MNQKERKASRRLENEAAPLGPGERRAGRRVPAADRVSLVYYDPGAIVISGTLVDRSEGGFRVAHDRPGLGAGHDVRFCWGRTCGVARVVWTRQTGDRLESGFAISRKGAIQ